MHQDMDHKENDKSPYIRILIMAAISFMSMYILMYAMVDVFDNVYSSLNQLYMAGLMTAPMVIIEIILMRMMYRNRAWNALILAISAFALISFWILIRQQVGINDKQFLRSMISHHASAILMCEKAPIQDLEIKALCNEILSSQQSQIDQMKDKLSELNK